MSYDSNSQHSSARSDPVVEIGWTILMGILIILGAPVLLTGLVGHRLMKRWTQPLSSVSQRLSWSAVVLLALGSLFLGYHFFWPLSRPGSPLVPLVLDIARCLRNQVPWDGWRLLRELLPVWAISLLLTPTAVCFYGMNEMAHPQTPRQLAQAQKHQKLALTRRANNKALRRLTRKPLPDAIQVGDESAIVLGVPVEGELLAWIKKGLFYLPLEYLIRHAVVLGASGSGKSETLIRIAVAAAKVLGWQVIYVDAKGDSKMMAKFQLAMEEAGIKQVRLFPMESYNGWVGTRDALLSRLLAIDNVAEVTNAGQQHYQTVRENLVEMAINAPGGPPRSSEELLARLLLTNGTLYDLYAGYPEQQGYLEAILKREQDALSAYGHYRAFFAKLHGKLDGSWSFDNGDVAYILLEGLSMPEMTDGIARFLLADLVNYATRKAWNKRVMCVFDEVGALNVPLYNVFEKIRFRNLTFVVSSQDPSGLAHRPGAWDEVKRVLGNAAIKIVHRCEDAYEVIRRAGTVTVPDTGYRLDSAGMNTGGGTTHLREELKIDLNEVLRLKAGEAFVVGPGEYERVRVAMREVDQAQLEWLFERLERQAKAEPPPRPRRPGGPMVVDSTLGPPPAARPTPSSKQRPGGAPKHGTRPASPVPPKTPTPKAQTVPRVVPPVQKLPGLPGTAPGNGGRDVDEMLPFSLPEADQHAPTQPGILPMWNEQEDEDLLT